MTEPTTSPLDDDHGSHLGAPSGSVMHVVYVFSLAAVVLGLYFGTHYHPNAEGLHFAPHTPGQPGHSGPLAAGVVRSLSYDEIERGNLGPNAGLRTRLAPPASAPVPNTAILPGDAAQLRADLAARAKRRAYNGAPPTIPHRVDPRDASSCAGCHGPHGMRQGTVVARPMPHAHYDSCTQCHVPVQELTDEESRWLDNSFAGLPAPTAGHRAAPGAPPVIPHSTLMRENCLSCHGPLGARGLQSSHPWRSSCTQCHAPSSALDQQPPAPSDAPLFLPGPRVIPAGAESASGE